MEHITNQEIIDYLKRFPANAPLSILLANPEARVVYSMEGFGCLVDEEITHPVFCIEVGEAKDMDEEMVKACEEDERVEEKETELRKARHNLSFEMYTSLKAYEKAKVLT